MLPWKQETMRRNRQGREIWFDRVLWSYMPCNWKGWAVLGGTVLIGNAGIWLLSWLLGDRDGDFRAFLALAPTVIAGLWLAERHSPSRAE
jgi:hypothetical protein